MSAAMHPGPARPRSWRAFVLGAVVGVCLGLVLTVSALVVVGMIGASDGTLSWSGSGDNEITIDSERIAVSMTVPHGMAVHSVDTDAHRDCRAVRYRFGGDLTVEAYASDCKVDDTQQTINGDHGTYRTLEDVPEPVDVSEEDTPAGPAQIFVQRYEEYTNTSNSWDEPVAIVTLDEPVDADFPTLVLRSDKAELSREELTAVALSLSPIERP